MATSTTNKSVCAVCSKTNGIFTCRGCQKDYCLRHANEHRQVLGTELDEKVIIVHDHLKALIDEQTTDSAFVPLLNKIKEWEEESIKKIHQTAEDVRKQLMSVIDQNVDKLKKSLDDLAQELKIAREEENFFEDDIKNWIKRLDEIKTKSTTTPEIDLRLENITIDSTNALSIRHEQNLTEDWFDRAFGNITISDDHKLITHQGTSIYASVRGRQEYSTGKHRLRFKLEYLDNNKWFFIGVVSKTTMSTGVGSIGANTYGFSGQNNVWRNGSNVAGLNGYQSDFQTGDVIDLLIDCDQRIIQLSNERIGGTVHSLEIDLSACSFPWKLTVGLYYSPDERIRLLT